MVEDRNEIRAARRSGQSLRLIMLVIALALGLVALAILAFAVY